MERQIFVPADKLELEAYKILDVKNEHGGDVYVLSLEGHVDMSVSEAWFKHHNPAAGKYFCMVGSQAWTAEGHIFEKAYRRVDVRIPEVLPAVQQIPEGAFLATKRPVTIVAMEYTGENAVSIIEWAGDSAVGTGPNREIVIKTLEGNLTAVKSDIIIRGVNGEFYPCKPNIFDKTYAIEPTNKPEPVTGPGMQWYQSHKRVQAAQIHAIEPTVEGAHLHFSGGLILHVDHEYMNKHRPFVGGYYVRYSDGYQSYSPAEAFEGGYTVLREDEPEQPEARSMTLADVQAFEEEMSKNFSLPNTRIDPVGTVYPSDFNSVFSMDNGDGYGGAHHYCCIPSLGFENGAPVYRGIHPYIDVVFIEKPANGMPTKAGLQSEQLLLILLDRHRKLNAKFPSEFHEVFEIGIKMALDAQKARVDDRMSRGVMGELKK